jgi:hypothetical protein
VGSGFAGSFNATVNGIPITGRSLAIDPFSYPNALVLHYLINKDDIIKIAEARQKQLQQHPEQQQQQQGNNITNAATATNSSSSSTSSASNTSNANSLSNNKTSTTPTTKVSNANATALTTSSTTTPPIEKTRASSQSSTVSKTAYNDNDIQGIFKNKDTNLYDQSVARPKLILVAANASSITNSNNITNTNNKNTPTSSIISHNRQKASDLGVMTFALMSNAESNKKTPSSAAASAQTSSDLATDTGAIHVIVTWSPNPLAPAKESNVKVQFSDAMTSGPLNADVKYDLMILDKNGTTAVKKENLVAKNGLGTQTVTFPAKDVYQLEIKIKALQRTGQAVPDLSRNGIARGYVVVPEFPSFTGSALLISGLFAFAIFFTRRFKSAYKI